LTAVGSILIADDDNDDVFLYKMSHTSRHTTIALLCRISRNLLLNAVSFYFAHLV